MTIKKAMILGALGSILVGLTAFALNKNNKLKIQTTYADEQETANGIWHFNDTPTNLYNQTDQNTYNINFTMIENIGIPNNFTTFTFRQNNFRYNNYVAYDFYDNRWISTEYKSIQITGGTDTTNPLFIQWLKQNATNITTTDLTMTTWQIKQTPNEIPAGYYRQWGAIIQCNGMLMSGIYLGYNESETALANTITIGNKNIYNNGTWLNDSQGNYNQYSKFIIFSVETQDLKLITWLFNNATQYKTITDLKNTQWQFITNPAIPNNSNWNINFTSNGQTYTNIILDNTNHKIQYKRYNGTDPFHAYDDIRDNAYETSYWTNNNYKKITITDGADTTNLYAISYFISNAQGTSFTPIPTGNNNYDIETGNFVSLQELILRILTLPFTFIAQAFDITLWPNTAWEFNLSNFFLALIGIATILFIIKLFTSGFSVIGNYTGHPIQTHEKNKNLRSKTKLNKAKTEKIKNKE